MADRVGQQLGSYRLIRLLGEGGFAEVYLGEHIHLNTFAAIKVLHTQLADDGLETFRTEARTIARLTHPHIVHVLEFNIEGKTPFLVMDYAPGGTLRSRHPKGTRLPLPTIVSYILQAASALQYAHDEKLIHRDIKPENMLLGNRNEVLLSDFGIALVAQSSRYQSLQDLAGTMAYMAPEQIQGKPRPASDQYSLGIVVYEWLSGERPFHGSLPEIVAQHLAVPPLPLRKRDSALSPEVEQVVMTALAKEPKQRFASVQTFANALEQASQLTPGTSIWSSQPSPLSKAVPPPIQSQQIPPLVAPRMDRYTSIADFPPPPRRGISRRTVMKGLTGLAVVGTVGGGIAWLVHNYFLEPPDPAISSSGAMFGYDLQRTSFYVDEHILSSANVSRLVLDWVATTGVSFLGIGSDSSPVAVNGIVYINANDDKLYAFRASTGELLWTASTGGASTSSPAIANGVVYIGSSVGVLYAFNASNGNGLWAYTVPSANGSPSVMLSSPIISRGVVFVGSGDGKLYAVNASNGVPLWTASTGDSIESSATIAGNTIYIGSDDHRFYAFDISTGRTLWTALTGDIIKSSPAVANGVVYIGSNDGKLYAFNAQTGQTLWSFNATSPTNSQTYILSSPAVANGVVYIGSNDGKLYALDAHSGKTLWSATTDAPAFGSTTNPSINSSPAVANGVVYIGSVGGKLYAFNAQTGRTLWTGSIVDPTGSSPAVANGVIYIGTTKGKLYAFHLAR
ncbi:MAG: serine/threonine-protein kinase [Ktedonobacteraceae bacterium]